MATCQRKLIHKLFEAGRLAQPKASACIMAFAAHASVGMVETLAQLSVSQRKLVSLASNCA